MYAVVQDPLQETEPKVEFQHVPTLFVLRLQRTWRGDFHESHQIFRSEQLPTTQKVFLEWKTKLQKQTRPCLPSPCSLQLQEEIRRGWIQSQPSGGIQQPCCWPPAWSLNFDPCWEGREGCCLQGYSEVLWPACYATETVQWSTVRGAGGRGRERRVASIIVCTNFQFTGQLWCSTHTKTNGVGCSH